MTLFDAADPPKVTSITVSQSFVNRSDVARLARSCKIPPGSTE
jgi:hypothetical protein